MFLFSSQWKRNHHIAKRTGQNLRLNNSKRWFWLALKWKFFLRSKGSRATVVTTTTCNLHCDYCPMFIYGEVKKYEISTVEEWQRWFKRFPIKLSLLFVSGGEPSIYPHIVPLVNWLISQGYHIIIFTNLFKVDNFIGIKPHWRLLFMPTFHDVKGNSRERFNNSYRLLIEKGFQVSTQQLFENTGNFWRTKEFFTPDWFKEEDDGFQFAPDTPRTLQIWSGCVNLYKDDK